MTVPEVGNGPPALAPKRRRRWLTAVVAAWVMVLGLISWWSVRNDPPTVADQQGIEQAMPALRRAAGVLLGAAGSAASTNVPSRNEIPGRTTSGPPWAVRLGAVRSESCALTPVRAGVEAHREVFLYVPQGQAKLALERVAATLPSGYHADVMDLRIGTRLSFYADAGDFIAIEGEAKPDDQVLTLSVATGCRPGTTAGGSDPAAPPVPAVLGETVTALGGRPDAEVSTQAVACPGGGTAATYQAAAGPGGDGPRGVPSGVTPVWSQAGGWAYAQESDFVVVDDSGENLQVSVTTACR
ncbi:hypothetical protein [Actinoplanes sp. NPDC020271]|uniref:hypothetical protein n=1 Tax=Actinoplanes sp. NPDC020271 TaxID=3363896 RepID=UPI0037AFA419